MFYSTNNYGLKNLDLSLGLNVINYEHRLY